MKKTWQPTRFFKYQAAGNDFALFESVARPTPAQVRVLCARHFGIGADGIIVMHPESGARSAVRWSWSYFNNDGSLAEICGNACRCVTHWLSVHKKAKGLIRFRAKPGIVQGRALRGAFEVTWPTGPLRTQAIPEDLYEELIMAFNDRGLAGAFWVNVGNPHLVLLNHGKWNEQDRAASSPKLRSHPALGIEGANISWLNLEDLRVVTFERGVEAETLACGSGALACFIALREHARSQQKSVPRTVNLGFPGGRLGVTLKGDELWLKGEAHLVYRGEIGVKI